MKTSMGTVVGMGVGLVTLLAGARASASYCTTTSLATLTSAAYTTHWGAYDGLRCVEEHLLAAADRRAIFASVYTLTTLRMAESIDASEYTNTEWMKSYQTEFANHYRRALNAYANGQRSQVPNAWLKAFDAAAGGQTLIIQDALLGMNAHINYDLAFAIETVKMSPNTTSRYLDHTRVNAVLGEVGDEIVSALGSLYGAHYAAVDAAFGPADELFLAFGMATARQNAWNNAVLLKNSQFWNRWIVVGAIDAAAVTSANLALAPTLSPTLRATLRALEGSNPGSTFCQHFPCAP
ncbi:MAG TPA: DUF5995 family protein [Polyangiaceae bacterium]